MQVNKRVAAVVGAVILALGVGAGIARATIPSSSGSITACYKTPVPAHGTPLSVIDTDAGGTFGDAHIFTDPPDNELLFHQETPPEINGDVENAQAWVVQVNATPSYPGVTVWALCAE